MKIKSSAILQEALDNIVAGEQRYVCAAIQDVETELRLFYNENISSKAMQVFSKHKPEWVRDDVKLSSSWWPKGSGERLAALQKSIETAISKGD